MAYYKDTERLREQRRAYYERNRDRIREQRRASRELNRVIRIMLGLLARYKDKRP